jgi:hypothetical protein
MLSLGNRLTLPTSSNSAGGLLLDNFGADVARAYSVRRLNSAYSGYSVRVREASADEEADVGFDVNGNLSFDAPIYNATDGTADGTSLGHWFTSVLEETDGFVKVWYDQSNLGFNMSQGTKNKQPQLIDTNILQVNGRPALSFDGSDDLFPFDESDLNLADISTFTVVKHDVFNASTKVVWVASWDVNNYYMLLQNSSAHMFYYSDDFNVSQNSISNNQFLVTNIAGPVLGVATQFQDGVQGAGTNPLDNSDLTDSASNGVMGTSAGSYFCNGHLQELIFYADDKSPEREAIERNINAYYKIY